MTRTHRTVIASLLGLTLLAPGAAPTPALAQSTGCARHFFDIEWDALVACAATFAKSGLYLRAFAAKPFDDLHDTDSRRHFDGSFEPGPPVELDLDGTIQGVVEICSNIVAIYDGYPDNLPYVCGKDAPETFPVALMRLRSQSEHMQDLDVDPGDPGIRARYVAIVAREATHGYAPFRAIIHSAIGAGVTSEATLLFQRMPPQDSASQYLPETAPLAAFEKRAIAKGFQPYHYDNVIALWRKGVAATVVMKAGLSRAEFAAWDALETQRGLYLIDICKPTPYAPGIRAIWASK